MSETHQEMPRAKQTHIDPDLMDSAQRKVSAATTQIADTAREQTAILRDTLEDGAQAAGEQIQKAEQSARDAGDTIAEAVRRNPTLAVGGALGFGLLLGLAISRGR
ncbi:MAG: hypothetical protein AAGF30_12665 [Pseudomonadota bacterium]